MFDHTSYGLSQRGILKLWKGLNEAVCRVDMGKMRPYKYVYAELQNGKDWKNKERAKMH